MFPYYPYAYRDGDILRSLFALQEATLRQLLSHVDVRTTKLRLYRVNVSLMPQHITIDHAEYTEATLFAYLRCFGLAMKIFHPQYLLLLKILAPNAHEATAALNDMAHHDAYQWSTSDVGLCECACALIRYNARYTGSAVDALELPPKVRSVLSALVAERNAAKRTKRTLLCIARRRPRWIPRDLILMIADMFEE
jgi:hypothetical protein